MEIYIKILPLTWGMKTAGYKYLIAILVLALSLRIIFFTGADHSDSLLYYTYANEAAKGTFELTQNHFSSRIGLIYPQALVYRLFGVSEFTSNVLSLIISLAGIILIFYLGRMLFNEKTGLIAALLLSFYPLDVIFATRLLPDFPSAFFMALSVFFFLKAEKETKKAGFYFLSGLSWGIAYLIKEVSVILAFFFFAYAIYKRKFNKSYLLILLGFVLLLLVEFLYFYSGTGNPFFRHSQIESEEVSYLLESYSNYFTLPGMVSRLLFHWPFLILHDLHYGLFFAFIFIAAAYCIFNRKENSSILLIWIVSLMLYMNFGTLSLKNYIPIPITAKFLSIITFPCILLLAYFLGRDDKILKNAIAPSILALLFLSSIGFIHLSDERTIINEIKEAGNFIKNQDKEVYTDERTHMVLNYLSGFKDNKNIRDFNKFDLFAKDGKNILTDLKDKHDALIIANMGMIKGLPKLYRDIEFPEQLINPPKNWQLVKEFGKEDKKVLIYYAR